VLENDGIAAFDHLSTFSKLLRSVLDHSAREYLTLEEEMAFLRNYLSLEAARIQGQLRYSITVDPALEEEGHRIPTLITQPFVENALRHGLLHKEGEKRLEIAVTPAGRGGLSIRIRDNGIGRKASAELNAQQPGRHRSFAVEAMTQRIAFIRESGGPRVVIETRDLPEGTEVEIRIDHA
jgi:LytS/YehU family sensor histidine kinase